MPTSKTRSAEKSWSMWHQKEPREVLEVDVDVPEHVYSIGTAETITYASDKWEKDGDFYDYVHEFETSPEVFVSEKYAGQEAGRRVSSKRLLGTRVDLKSGELGMPLLANTKELIIQPTGADAKHCIRFSKEQPPMCCSADLKTLVIFSRKHGPIFIRGGRMVVTERGIVR